jgi:hypothetical protein
VQRRIVVDQLVLRDLQHERPFGHLERSAQTLICCVCSGSWVTSRRLERSSGHTIQLSVRIEPQREPNVSSYALRPSEIA